ncbi:MAG: hypothetical protein IJL83_02270 [Clostridia bacterium]|nr:hypothetical protein [Clostridia bacterium]
MGLRYLPKLPYQTQQKESQILQFRGLDLTDNYSAGSIVESENISSRRYPYITSRNARELVEGYNVAFSLTEWDDLVVVERGNPLTSEVRIKIGDEVVRSGGILLTTQPKQFAVVNTKLVIWPDKVYIDMSEQTRTLRPLGHKVTGVAGTFDADANTLTVTSGDVSGFKLNDVILVSGCVNTDNNIYLRIYSVAGNVITFDDAYTSLVLESGSETDMTLDRDIPDMDYICASENRLWGCSSATQTIWASALGDPTNFYTYSGLTTDSYVIPVGTDDAFTGCAAYSSSVLFWKEERLHKVLGSNPTEYQIYTYTMEGVKDGCYKSITNVNDTLFYVGLHGVYAYSGGSARLISEALGETAFDDAVAGSDGENYYLSARTAGEWNMWAFSLKTGLWVREDNSRVIDFARDGVDLYAIIGGFVRKVNGSGQIDGDTPWSLTFAPFFETTTGNYGAARAVFTKKRYGKIHIRAELPAGSFLVASVRQDSGRWTEAGRIVGAASGVHTMVVPIKTCDKFELKLSGEGPFTVLGLERLYRIGSER